MKRIKAVTALASLLGFSIFGAATRNEIQAMVDAHNSVRSRVGVPQLQWSNQLSEQAQRWADDLMNRNAFVPERGRAWGQNLYEIVNGSANPWQVVAGWASEASNYDRATNTCSGRCGHYTQIVWRDTKYFGCATARRNARELWVCDYFPPGNIIGEHPY